MPLELTSILNLSLHFIISPPIYIFNCKSLLMGIFLPRHMPHHNNNSCNFATVWKFEILEALHMGMLLEPHECNISKTKNWYVSRCKAHYCLTKPQTCVNLIFCSCLLHSWLTLIVLHSKNYILYLYFCNCWVHMKIKTIEYELKFKTSTCTLALMI